ncbi:MAG: SelB C-terminal domain-containing protein [Variovorax sp.]|nr:SelB C-terminal domain-containing protein [Variovorax sp.]
MILGTAGHIDHGKTTLVRALTGVDTDRLKEEKARGISIELGYAYTPVPPAPGDASGEAAAQASAAAPADDPAQVLGIIDVPGHERFVHTMAAGASGIDHALLVVAADDGVMPQTREHLAIVELFGIGEGTVALTKCDRVDAARIAAVKADIAALLAGTPLAGAPIFETGIPPLPSGDRLGGGHRAVVADGGITALRTHLFAIARRQHARRQDGLFRLAVDRVFTLAGHGTVVTGTVFGGRIAAGDTVAHFGIGSGDGRAPPRAVRVRSLHAQNRAAPTGAAGQRVALNLAGVDKNDIARGDWIADPRVLQATQRIDVRVRLLDGAPPIAAWTPLHVHIGAAHRLAHAVPLQGDTVVAGASAAAGQGAVTSAAGQARVQLVFDQPVFVVSGDRLILRNAQCTRTVGGGVVLDPQAPERRRRSAERMQWLDALERLVADGDARPLLAAAPAGLTRSGLARLLGRLPADGWAGPDAPAFALGQAGPRSRDASAGFQAKSAASARPVGASSYEIDSRPGGAGATPPAADAPPHAASATAAHGGDVLWLSPAAWAQVRARILDALDRHHARAPDEPGLNSARLQRMAFPAQSAAGGGAGPAGARLPGWPAWIEGLIAEGSIVRSGQWLHLPGHSVSLSDDESAMAAQLMPLLLAGGNDPPWVRDLAKAIGAREDTVRDLLRKQARLGALYQVVKDLFYPAERVAELAATFAALSAASLAAPQARGALSAATPAPDDPPPFGLSLSKPSPQAALRTARLPPGAVEARDFRDAVQLGRKRAIQILEFFDRVGYTRRVGDAHLLRPQARWTSEGVATGDS